MISDITIGQYYKENSIVHRLDPRNKVLLTAVLMAMIFCCKNFISLAVVAVVLLVSIFFSKVPLKMFFKSLKSIVPIILFTALLNLFYIKGGREWHFWILTVSEKGVYTAVFMAVRIVLLIVASSILTYTTVPTMLTDAIEKLLSPLKIFHISVHSVAMMMTLALRFIPTLIEEIERITNAQKARGADFENGKLTERIKSLIPVLVPLFVSSFKRAYDLAFAMSCRCYTGGEGRTRMKQMKFGIRDIFAVLFYVVSFSGIILSNNYFGALI